MTMFDVVAVDDFFVSSKFAIILDADENELPQIKNYKLINQRETTFIICYPHF